jgi:prephenate dehydratase
MVSEGNYNTLEGTFASDHLKMVQINCENLDGRINKVLKILSTFGISLDKINIRQTDTSPGSGCKLKVLEFCMCILL